MTAPTPRQAFGNVEVSKMDEAKAWRLVEAAEPGHHALLAASIATALATTGAIRFPDRLYDVTAEWLRREYGDAVPGRDWNGDALRLLIMARAVMEEYR